MSIKEQARLSVSSSQSRHTYISNPRNYHSCIIETFYLYSVDLCFSSLAATKCVIISITILQGYTEEVAARASRRSMSRVSQESPTLAECTR